MSIAPVQRPGAPRKDAVAVARLERAPGRRRQRPAGVVELVLQLALSGDPAYGRVAGIALDRLLRHRAAALELAGGRALRPGQGVQAGADDQLRPRPRAVALAA